MEKITKIIIELAASRFTQLGIRNVSIDDICNELRISKKTFYKYFSQKEDLIVAVLVNFGEQNKKKFSRIYENNNSIDALVQIIMELKKTEDNKPHAFLHDLKKYYPEIDSKFREKQMLVIREDFESNLKKGIDEGYYREDIDVEMVSYFHSMHLRSLFEQIQESSTKISKKRMMNFFIDLITRLITNEKGYEYVQNKLQKDKN
ncbi:MAG: transcriptional regulator [Bacteroidetes bacterium]|nr:transcriptional regulator [Bacteroidota bacterium]